MDTAPLPQPASEPSTRGAGIDLSNLHPVFQQALAPFVLSRYRYGGVNYSELQEMQAAMEHDRKALDAQINRPQTNEGFFV